MKMIKLLIIVTVFSIVALPNFSCAQVIRHHKHVKNKSQYQYRKSKNTGLKTFNTDSENYYDQSSYNRSKQIEEDPEIAKKEILLYSNETQPELTAINPSVSNSLWIRASTLLNLVSKDSSQEFVRMDIVQITKQVDSVHKHLKTDDIYFFFSLANKQREVVGAYYDLDSSLDSLTMIDKTDFDECLKYFNDLGNAKCLKNGLLKVKNRKFANKNTERIYCPMNEMLAYLHRAYTADPTFKYIKLEFCQIDTSLHSYTNPEREKYAIRNKDNNNHMGVIWKSYDANTVQLKNDFPVYDLNELCPNQCAK